MALMGITGNINVPGGQVLFKTPNIVKVSTFGAHKQLPKEQVAKRLGASDFGWPASSASSIPSAFGMPCSTRNLTL